MKNINTESITIKYILLIATLLIFSVQIYAQTCNTSIKSTTPDSRFSTTGSEVTDIETGLIWQKCSLGQNVNDCSSSATYYTWQEALQAAEALRQQTGVNWRLPDIKELESLIEEKCHNPSINLSYFPNTNSSFFAFYWSASSDAYFSNYAWYVNFDIGPTYTGDKNNSAYVRLVRTGQSSFSLPEILLLLL